MAGHPFSRRVLLGVLCPATLALSAPALAQIIPDATLGDEGTRVSPGEIAVGDLADLIEGGAQRGGNLFHSFLEFNVDAGQRLYFANPAGVNAILTRITGDNASTIFGTLGVDGSADLFLINPNGLVFGETASLDIAGSFYASTAEAIALGNEVYSAVTPEQSRLLTVSPSALLSTYLTAASGPIESWGQLAAGQNLTLAAPQLDLQNQVAAGGDLTLLATDTVHIRDRTDTPFVAFAGGGLLVQGNDQVDIVALSHSDSGLFAYGDMVLRSANPVVGDAHYWSGGSFRVETLNGAAGDLFSPIDPIIRAFGDVEIGVYQGASLHILAGGSVNIGTAIITAPDSGAAGVGFLQETVTLSDGTVVEIDGGTQPTLDVRAGVTPGAIGLVPLGNISGLGTDILAGFSTTSEALRADITVGDVRLDAPNGLVLLTNQYEPTANLAGGNLSITGDGVFGFGINARALMGQSGRIYIDTRNNMAAIDSAIDTTGTGNVGSIWIRANETVSFDRRSRRTGVFSNLGGGTGGIGGNINISASNVELIGGAQLSASTLSDGDAGNVVIAAQNRVIFDGTSADNQVASAALSRVSSGALGTGGNVEIYTNILEVLNGAQLLADTLGSGDAGNIVINARDRVTFVGISSDGRFASAAFSRVGLGATGQGGNIEIRGNTLDVTNRAGLVADTLGIGNAGNILISVKDRVSFDRSAAISSVGRDGVGSGGNIKIHANVLEVINGAELSASTSGFGNAGNVVITAQDLVVFDNTSPDGRLASAAFSQVNAGATGNGGNIEIYANTLKVLNGAGLVANTLNTGDAGNVLIFATDQVIFRGTSADGRFASAAFSRVEPGAIGRGGNLEISSNQLQLLEGAQLLANTLGDGDAGNVVITAHDLAIFDNGAVISSVGRNAIGAGGNIEIRTSNLEVINGAQLVTTTFGEGNAGSVILKAPTQVNLQGSSVFGRPSGIFADNTGLATGQSNDIYVTTFNLIVQNGAVLIASTLNDQPGGNIILSIGNLAVLDGGQVATNSSGTGAAGSIRIDATEGILIAGRDPNFEARVAQISEIGVLGIPQSALSVRSSGEGEAGSIVIGAAGTTPWLVLEDGGQITAESAAVDGGNIAIDLNNLLLLRGGSQISTTAGTAQLGGDGGNITIRVPFIVAIPEENSDIAADAFEGAGGNVSITARGIFGIEPRTQRTPLSDITASSELGVSGIVAVSVLDTGFIENSLAALPDTVVDTEQLIAGSCIARTDSGGSFIVSGRGGLPDRPSETFIAPYATGSVRPLPEADPHQPLQEPDGLYQLPDGRVVLSRACN